MLLGFRQEGNNGRWQCNDGGRQLLGFFESDPNMY